MTRALGVGVVIADTALRHSVVDCLNHLRVRIAFAISPASGDVSTAEYSNPDVLVLDFGHRSAFEIMETIKSLGTPPPVIAAHVSADPDLILAAVRAGAREFLYPPIGVETLTTALDKIADELLMKAPPHRTGKAIGFLSADGGSGATTVACHVAAELSRITSAGTLAADFDLLGGMVGFWLKANGAYSLLDIIRNLGRMDLSLWKGMVQSVQPHLDAIGAPAEIPVGELPPAANFATVLRYACANYGWVVADLGQGLSPLAMALIPELDTLYLVTTPEVAPLYQARRIVNKVLSQQCTRELPRVVVNRVRREYAQESKAIEKLLAVPIEAYLPEDYHELVEAHAGGRLVASRSDLGGRLAQLTAKIAGQRPVERREPRFSFLRQFRARAAAQ
jgi:pilus assembly protein CpaE